jgi:hypothetical protein
LLRNGQMFTKRLRMKCEEPEPLWQSVVGEKEPWRLLNPPHGRSNLTKFLQDATMVAGDVHAIYKPNGLVSLRYSFPVSFVAEGEMRTEDVGSKGRILMRMRLGGTAGDWKIDEITWIFPDSFRKP